MLKLQIIERDGAALYKTLADDMRTGALRTFSVLKRGKRSCIQRVPDGSIGRMRRES